MSSKPKRNGSTGLHTTPTQTGETGEAMVGNPAHDENTRRRAYEICLERADNRAVSWTIGSKPSASSKYKVLWQASTGISDAGF
jgi:hypothetical protein